MQPEPVVRHLHVTAAVLAVALAAGCGDSGGRAGSGGSVGSGGAAGSAGSGGQVPTEPSVPDLPWEATKFPPLPAVMEDVPEAQIELGKALFYDPILSTDRETACATCHSESWGMSDFLPRSIGHSAGLIAGPDRRGPNVLRRNSPTLFNMAFRSSFFLDGRTNTLEEQALMPLLTEDELDRDPEELIADLAAIAEYASLFAAAFPDDPRVTVDNFAAALAAFQRTFISNRSLYEGYVDGDLLAFSDEMVEGMFRFAEMGCDDCHVPPLFESETFADRNVPGIEGVVDNGREEATEDPADRGKFRTPTLRNIKFTEPYFHNGTFRQLDEAVIHELEQGGIPYTDEDARLITLFIEKTLNDESHKPTRPAAVPSGLPMPIDERR
jgi:cytochrome c peroxidase